MHTLDLPLGTRTSDAELNRLSLQEERVRVTKDADFVDSLFLAKGLYRVLLVSTGHITNNELLHRFLLRFQQIVEALQQSEFVELG